MLPSNLTGLSQRCEHIPIHQAIATDIGSSRTAVLITLIYCVNIVVFLMILPFGTIGLKRITTLPTTGVDLLIARCSLGLLAS